MSFPCPIEQKESETIDNYQDITKELKKVEEHGGDSDTVVVGTVSKGLEKRPGNWRSEEETRSLLITLLKSARIFRRILKT